MPTEITTFADAIERLKLTKRVFCAACGAVAALVILDLESEIAEGFCLTCIEIRVTVPK